MHDFSEVVSGFGVCMFSTNARLLRSRDRVWALYVFYKCSTSPKLCVGSGIVCFLQMFYFSEVVSGFGHCMFSTNVRPLARSSLCLMIY
jgi:hypothetical protein